MTKKTCVWLLAVWLQCLKTSNESPYINITGCLLTLSSEDWAVSMVCQVNVTSVPGAVYECIWYQTKGHQGSSAENWTSSFLEQTYSASGQQYNSGRCEFKNLLPDDGFYRYYLQFNPGSTTVSVGNMTIKSPKTPSAPECTSYVMEHDTLSCNCTTTDPGSPPAVLLWSGFSGQQLVVPDVQRDMNGTTYTCTQIWKGRTYGSVTYLLQVASTYSSTVKTRPDASTNADVNNGLPVAAVGGGVGGAAVLIFVISVIAVVVTLRRKFTRKDAMERPMRSQDEVYSGADGCSSMKDCRPTVAETAVYAVPDGKSSFTESRRKVVEADKKPDVQADEYAVVSRNSQRGPNRSAEYDHINKLPSNVPCDVYAQVDRSSKRRSQGSLPNSQDVRPPKTEPDIYALVKKPEPSAKPKPPVKPKLKSVSGHEAEQSQHQPEVTQQALKEDDYNILSHQPTSRDPDPQYSHIGDA